MTECEGITDDRSQDDMTVLCEHDCVAMDEDYGAEWAECIDDALQTTDVTCYEPVSLCGGRPLDGKAG